MSMVDIEDRAFQIYMKLQRDKSPIHIYAIGDGFRTTKKSGNFGGATLDKLVGVYDERAELTWIENDLAYMEGVQ